jgi:hypothetical protein
MPPPPTLWGKEISKCWEKFVKILTIKKNLKILKKVLTFYAKCAII